MKNFVLSMALLALCGSVQAAEKMSKLEAACPWAQAASKFRKAVAAAGGVTEPLHLHEGLAVLATGTGKKAAAINSAAKTLASEVQAFKSLAPGAKSELCVNLVNGAAGGLMSVQVEETSRGVLVAFFSKDAKVVEALHLGGCCDYCVCPAGTVTRCASCC